MTRRGFHRMFTHPHAQPWKNQRGEVQHRPKHLSSDSRGPNSSPLLKHLKSIKCLLYCACHGKCIYADPLQMSHACHAERHLSVQKWSEPRVFLTFWLRHVLRATTAYTFSTSQLPKVVRQWCVLYILTSKCASRHNGVHFFDISTSKSGPTMVCFVHFDCDMCFAPQRRALFRHLNFQKWSENGVFWCVLYILTSKYASRHNGVQFFISHLASWLRTRRFSEPTFRPSGATNHWKNRVFRNFPTFSRICIFFLLTLSFLLFSLLIFLFSLPLALLCFSSVHIVGSLTSKLPSVIK